MRLASPPSEVVMRQVEREMLGEAIMAVDTEAVLSAAMIERIVDAVLAEVAR